MFVVPARPTGYLVSGPCARAGFGDRDAEAQAQPEERSRMRLTHLCDMHLVFDENPILVRPYGGEDGSSFGQGGGTVSGERLRGTARWVNLPHRRGDGAMLPHIRGAITTPDGAAVLFAMRGRTVWRQTAEGVLGNQLLSVLFESEDARHRWLNDAVCVLEGTVIPPVPSRPRPESPVVMRVYVCENELLPPLED
jgi:hypothetical protein